MKTGDIIDLSITGLGSGGEGIGAVDSFKVFVEGVLPGEVVRARLSTVKKSYGKAAVVDIIEPSINRVQPVCPVFGRCGGCQVMHLAYHAQLATKRQQVVDALARIGHLPDVDVATCCPSPNEIGYRNKVQTAVVGSRRSPVVGFYSKGSHDVIPIDRCYIHCSAGEEVFEEVQRQIKTVGIDPYNEKTDKGTLRHIVIKSAINSGGVLVVLVTTGRQQRQVQALADAIIATSPVVHGVVESVNRRKSNVILGSDFQTLAGKGTIQESIAGLTFTISPAAFFQVNTLQAEQLYRHAIALGNIAGKRILDAYCGVGTLSCLVAGEAKNVVGIEVVPQAITDANANAALNHISNCQFICSTVEKVIDIADDIDTVFLNPPRKGCDPTVLETLIRKGPEHIVYISCNPATLARDLAILNEGGYTIGTVTPFDMFPQTMHVESVVGLTKN